LPERGQFARTAGRGQAALRKCGKEIANIGAICFGNVVGALGEPSGKILQIPLIGQAGVFRSAAFRRHHFEENFGQLRDCLKPSRGRYFQHQFLRFGFQAELAQDPDGGAHSVDIVDRRRGFAEREEQQ
jgi:hypothetical protein